MSSLDPYVQPIPKQIVDPNTGKPSDEFLSWLQYLNLWLHDAWQKLGGGSDDVEGAINEANANEGQIDQVFALLSGALDKISDLEQQMDEPTSTPPARNYVAVASSYTANDNDIVLASNGAQITLPLTPPNFARVSVKNSDGSLVSIVGTINGNSHVLTKKKGTYLEFLYLAEALEWSIE